VVLPEIDHDRLPSGVKGEPLVDRQLAVGPLEKVGRLLEAVVELDLQLNGVGLEVGEPAGGGQLGKGHGSAVEVYEE
jgi:hypothetical protein